MRMSVREARARFASALDAAERGEHVTITKNGKPVAEIGPPRKEAAPKEDFWERAARLREELGIETIDYDPWPPEFDDPAFSREVLGIGDDWDPNLR
jgi:prevent-host-death family protein